MATLQKLRDKGSKVLIGFVGVALFAFVAGDIVKLFQKNEIETITVGSINGKAISYNEFAQLRNECEAYFSLIYGDLNEGGQEVVTQATWNTLVRENVLADKAKEVGLTIDSEERDQFFADNTNGKMPRAFLTQDGKFSEELYEQYVGLIEAFENGEWAPQSQEEASMLQEIKISIVALPYVKRDMASDFTALKLEEQGVNTIELLNNAGTANQTFEVVYITPEVKPGKSEQEDLLAEFTGYAENLKNKSASIEEVAFSASSEIAYDGFLLGENSGRFAPHHIEKIKECNNGEVCQPYAEWDYNTYNLVNVIRKEMVPETIKLRYIVVQADSANVVAETTQKLMVDLKNKVPFDSIAKDYPSNTVEFNTNNLRAAEIIVTPEIQNQVYAAKVNAYNVVELNQNINFIVQVMEKKGEVAAYDAFIIQRKMPIYNDTYDKAYSELNQVILESGNVEGLMNNDGAKLCQLNANSINIDGIYGTRELLRWILSGNSEGKISEIIDYNIGNKKYFMVVGVKSVTNAEQKNNIVNKVYEHM